ncbi:MAG: PIG-L family deacetylase [Acidimicrobiales bacterium]
MRQQRTLLGVWAHPDDEAYLSAGLMAEFRRRGDRVVVVTATLGEHGTSDPVAWPPRRLAARRHSEHHDGTAAIAHHIATIQPDLIVTFGPDGMTGHPDHRAVSRWTTDAWAATRPVADLWYATLSAHFHQRWGSLNDEIGLWADQPEPPCTDADGLARHTRLPNSLADLKLAALAAHASQTRPLVELAGEATYREWWRAESFRRAELADASRMAQRAA